MKRARWQEPARPNMSPARRPVNRLFARHGVRDIASGFSGGICSFISRIRDRIRALLGGVGVGFSAFGGGIGGFVSDVRGFVSNVGSLLAGGKSKGADGGGSGENDFAHLVVILE